MLHLHNGDATAEIARASTLPGEHFAFREALIEGPAPGGLANGEWRRVRARHLSGSYGVDREQCERELAAQENKLATFAEHEEIVFWFEHDLFCQINLLYLLNWFSFRELQHTKLSLVCINQFRGVEDFRGLGQLSATQLASLLPDRTEIKRPQMKLASSAWQAYCSPNPTNIEALLESDTSALPFLAAALRLHLRRFPSVTNGLGEIENTCLEIIKSGTSHFKELFPRFGDAKPIYGLGDAQFWLALRRMNNARQPLVTHGGLNGNANGSELMHEVLQNASFKITEIGESVLRGKADFVSLNGIDIWLGGVHLDDVERLWRWDEQSGRIVCK